MTALEQVTPPIPTIELIPGVQFRRGATRPDGNCWEFYAEPHTWAGGIGGTWLPARNAYADDTVLDQMALVHRDCQKLATAIADAGVECGHIAPGHQLDGPQLMLVLADMVTMLKESESIHKVIADPRLVFENMKAGSIAKISLRSAIDLHGEVINGDDAQQLEIARLRAEVEELRPAAARYLSMRDCEWPGAMQQVGIVSRDNDSVWLHGEEADRKVDASRF